MRTLRTTFLNCLLVSLSQKKPIARCLLLFLIFYLSVGGLAALDPTRHISQYGHTAWRVQDGTVDVAGSITQTADGYLWLGTSNGLLRFDGVKFVPYASHGLNLPTRGFTSLAGARDGSLWIGLTNGLLRLKDGELRSYTGPNEESGISEILEDAGGTIWVTRYRVPSGEGPLCRVEGSGLHCFGKTDGIPVTYGLGLTKDKSGNIWFGSTVLCRWRPGSSSTYLNYVSKRQDAGDGVAAVAVGTSGEIWVAIDGTGPDLGVRHFSGGKWTPYVIPGFDGPNISAEGFLVDHNQSLWIATDKGIYRVHDGIAEHYGSSEGLSGDKLKDIYEDHEGNIWVSTDGGLDMFRDTAVLSYSSRQGLLGTPYTILALQDDSVWIGEDGVVEILKGHHRSVLGGKQRSDSPVTALFQDHRGVIWLGKTSNLMTYEHGRLEKVLTAAGDFSAVVEDTDQNIWALTANHGLFRIKNRAVQKIPSETSSPRGSRIVADPAGGIWIAARNGDLTHYADGIVRTVALNRHENSIVIWGIIADSDESVFEFTDKGLFRWDNRDWKILDSRNGLPCDGIYSLLKDNDGALWLYSRCGLVKIQRSEVEKWYQGSESKLTTEIFDKFDGAYPRGLGHPSQPVAAKTSDGKLWFINHSSVQTIDPKQVYKNTIPPPVYIEKIVADHKDFSVEEGLRLPALSRDVEIDYTALSFAAPEKVRFRYRLEGRDTGWQEPEARRQAYYTDLRPGNYRFHVIACNNSGVWNEVGAILDFNVAPAWYQNNWFRIACAAAFLLLLWFIYQIRLRQVHHQYSIGLEARVNERTRIARELHDTLLQSFHGLLLRLQTASYLLPTRPDDAKTTLDSVIDQASQAIAEGRDAVQSLRSSTVVTNDLAVAIRTVAEDLTAAETARTTPIVNVAVEGTQRELHPIVRDEAYRISVEVLRNAFQHAEANRIEVEIRYDAHQLRLRVRDDGKGMDAQLLDGEGRAGHFGLAGIRERAQLMGGNVELWSNVGSGTEVELTVPASTAYDAGRSGRTSSISNKGA
jgi:signal transduction histidine kinase/ligand-binding sensor domain-containing protein